MAVFDYSVLIILTILDSEMHAYLEFKIMCEATRLLIHAQNSQKSFFPNDVLNIPPKFWPKNVALQISDEESKRIDRDLKLKTWADVTPIVKIERISKTKSNYFHNGGYQEVEILGYGDSNDDGIEDIFIVVRDHVEDGDYYNIRLLSLSMNSKGNLEFIKEY